MRSDGPLSAAERCHDSFKSILKSQKLYLIFGHQYVICMLFCFASVNITKLLSELIISAKKVREPVSRTSVQSGRKEKLDQKFSTECRDCSVSAHMTPGAIIGY